ncbi:ABC transporter substrate-binding protein [Anaeromicropila herbilytica]|uniref:ABC transporter substrate-binding protein n=1 Tax=Anaeromicropila herbilytica TaxID=2785025 RepID=A0A7R7EIT2_9FIRM|nr:extracellular solute-binding protein [Anaeromicropila herbilytica]BCN29636.1 ABC transporter substrate-binding protein [Anaeromicropila herbilytica]
MKKTSKKVFTLLMVFVMILSLCACGKKTKETSSDKATTKPKEETATPEATATEDPGFDLGGRTIKIGTWFDVYYDSTHKSINDNPNVSNTETAQMQLDNVRRIEKKYNCKIQFVNLTWDGTMESINTSITAGTPDCDVYMTDLQFGPKAAASGLAQALEDFLPADSDVLKDQKIAKKLNVFGMDKDYLFTSQAIDTNGIGMAYNKTMLDELGLEDPQQLYKEGKWTWDKFEELAKACTKDNDGDGTTDVYGYGSIWTYTLPQFVLSNGGTIASTKTEGLSSPQVKEALEFINKLYTKDKAARPWNADDWNDNLNAWSDGKVAFWGTQAWVQSSFPDTKYEIHVVPYPQGPSGDGKAMTTVTGNWYMIPVGVKDPDKVYKVLEEYWDWYGDDTSLRDDTEWAEGCFQSEEDFNIIKDISTKTATDMWGGIGFDFGPEMLGMMDGSVTVSQAVETKKQVLQDLLNQIVKAD